MSLFTEATAHHHNGRSCWRFCDAEISDEHRASDEAAAEVIRQLVEALELHDDYAHHDPRRPSECRQCALEENDQEQAAIGRAWLAEHPEEA